MFLQRILANLELKCFISPMMVIISHTCVKLIGNKLYRMHFKRNLEELKHTSYLFVGKIDEKISGNLIEKVTDYTLNNEYLIDM